MNTSDRIGALVSSAIFDSYNSAIKKVYKDVYGEQVLVWWTSQKEKMCPDCGAMHGIRFSIEETDDKIPLHPYCECQWTTESELS